MIEIHSDNLLKSLNDRVITKVKSIIITTDVGDIIFTICNDTTISLTSTQAPSLLSDLDKKEITIEAQYNDMIVIK